MAETMRSVAAVGGGKVELVRDVPMPEIGPYEALVKIRRCGFCNGTDFHIIRGEMAVPVGALPTLIGHENVGEIVKLGSKVRNLNVGDIWLNVPFKLMPGTRYTKTWGAMSDYGVLQDEMAIREDYMELADEVLVPQLAARKLPKDIDLNDAAMLRTLGECLSAAKNFHVEGKDVLVYGCGPMGLATMRYMRYLGAKSITAIDSVDNRLELAKKLSGVDQTINFAKEDKDSILKDRLFDRVIDLVGLTSIIMEGSHRLRPYGIVGSMGVLKNTDAVMDVTKLKNNTLVQMLNFPYHEHATTYENIELFEKGVINPKDYYSHVVSVENIEEVLRLVTSKEAIKVIVDFD